MAGRPRKPTPLHVLDGHSSKAADRAASGEAPIEAVYLECPTDLDDDEKAAWAYYAKILGDMRVSTKDDAAALRILATSWAHLLRLEAYFRKLTADGGDSDSESAYIYESTTKDGGMMKRPRPEWPMYQDLKKEVTNLLGRFGLTPADRSKVKVVKGSTAKDPDDEFASA